MLLRPDLRAQISVDERKEIYEIWRRAVSIRTNLPQQLERTILFGKRYVSPTCHSVAHAFASLFNLEAVDGRWMFTLPWEAGTDGYPPEVTMRSILHSWVEFVTSAGNCFILDIYPDNGGPIFPALFPAPHPQFWTAVDIKSKNILKKALSRAAFKEEVDTLAAKMREIATKEQLIPKKGLE